MMQMRAMVWLKRGASGLLAGMVFCGMLTLSPVFAQQPSETSQAGTAAEPPQAQPEHSGSAQEVNEAEQGEEGASLTEQFKQSPAVKFVAKTTGLSLHNAYLLCLVINFAVVAGLIVFFMKKNIPGALRNRTAQIQQAMEEARRASADANQRLAEIGARLSKLDTEIAEMRAAADQETVAEEARMKAAAEEDARKIVQTAEQEIQAAGKQARRELTAHAAALAVTLATQQIQISQSADEALVRDFAQQLSSDGKTRGSGN